MAVPRFRARGRKRVRHQPGTMNKTEAAYAAVLESQRLAGVIQAWHFERVRLVLADRTTYMPDFMVEDAEGYVAFHEVKGFMRDDARVKLKVAADLFPAFPFKLVRAKGRGFTVEDV